MKSLPFFKKIKTNTLQAISRFSAFLEKYQNQNRLVGYGFSFILLPVLLILFFECMNQQSFIGGFLFLVHNPLGFLCNVLILCSSFSLALLFRKQLCMVFIIAAIWIIAGIANFIVLFFRVTPLTGNDLRLLNDAFDIIGKYINFFGILCIIALLALMLIGILFLLWQAPVTKKRIHFLKSLLIVGAVFALTRGSFALAWNSGALQTEFTELSQAYLKNGFVYCFSFTAIDVGIGKPENYSEYSIEQLTEVYETEQETAAPLRHMTEYPNIIIVQLESFFDVNRLKDFTFSENPLPNFTRLMESCGSGYLSVPVVGAGTVNTEFEMLTGMNIDDFGAGEYPYKTVMRDTTCETLAYNLKENGYLAHALHNNDGDFYERNQVYANMGFDTFTSVEYMNPYEYTPTGWAKDSILTYEIQNVLASTELQDFIFAISVQGHGSYPSDPDLPYEKHIEVSSTTIDDEAYLAQITYYVNQLYEMDQFVGTLQSWLENFNEDVILVMYGDHCPSLGLSDDALLEGTVYHTEYFIWNNMGLTFDDRNTEAFEIGSMVLEKIGIQNGAINAYHQNYNRLLEKQEISQDEYLKGLSELEYDILYGDCLSYNGVNPYAPTSLQMGTRPVVINNVIVDAMGDVKLFGSNFTIHSQAYINGDKCSTLYYNSGTLKLEDVKLEPGDTIEVWQGKLSRSEPYVYNE